RCLRHVRFTRDTHPLKRTGNLTASFQQLAYVLGRTGADGIERRVCNTDSDPDPSEKAAWRGEGGACVPLLRALRQDLPRRHPASCLCARARECRSAAKISSSVNKSG